MFTLSFTRFIVSCSYLSVFVTSVALCLSLFSAYGVNILKGDLEALKGEFISHSYQRTSRDFDNGHFAPHMWEKLGTPAFKRSHHKGTHKGPPSPTRSSDLRKKREQKVVTTPLSFLQLTAAANENPVLRGHVTTIPWTLSVQHGEALLSTDNKITVKQDSYYMVFGQVLFHNPAVIMGHLIRRRKSSDSGEGQQFADVLRCLQAMPRSNSANSCYAAGIVKLEQEDEIELVIPNRPQTNVSMDADSTFFGIIQLK